MKFCPQCGRGYLIGIHCVHDDAELIVNRCETCYREYDVHILHCEDDGAPLPILLQGPGAKEENTHEEGPKEENPQEPPSFTEVDPASEEAGSPDVGESFAIDDEPSPSVTPPPKASPEMSLKIQGSEKAPVSAFDAVEGLSEEDEESEFHSEETATESLESDDADEDTFVDPKDGLTEMVKTSATSGEFSFGIIGAMVFAGVTYWGYEYALLPGWANNFLCMWVCPGFSGLMALLLLFHAFYARGKAPCPHCGEWLTGFVYGTEVRHDPELCDACGRFSHGTGPEIWKVPEDYVSETPEFHAAFVDQFQVPEICCECGRPATRKMGVDWSVDDDDPIRFQCKDPELFKVNAGAASGEFMAPHCDKHHSGCEVKTGIWHPFSIYVKSHKFHLEFCRLNETRPQKKD